MNDAWECKDQLDLNEEECVTQPSSNLSSTVSGRGEELPAVKAVTHDAVSRSKLLLEPFVMEEIP